MASERLERRGFLKKVITLGTASAATCVLAAKTAAAQGPTTLALGEEGPPNQLPSPRPTTRAIGEEGRPPVQPPATTLMVGEETNCQQPPRPTTMRFGEEGQPPATTRAIGEEGPVPTTARVGEEGPAATTARVGEEMNYNPPAQRPTEVTTWMFGEESQRWQNAPQVPGPVPAELPRQWNGFQRW